MGDRGHRGHGPETTRALIGGSRRGLTPALVRLLRRHRAIEPGIGHRNTDGRLGRSPFAGTAGVAIFALLCARGYILPMIRSISGRF